MAIYRNRKRFGGGIPATGDNVIVTYEEETDTLNNTLPKLGKVKSVDDEEPDEDGNIVSKAVETVTTLPASKKDKVYIKSATSTEKKKVYAKDTELVTKEQLDATTEFDLTNATALSAVDLDTVSGGVYRVSKTCVHLPEINDGYLICFVRTNNNKEQVFFADSGATYTRTKLNTWQKWNKSAIWTDIAEENLTSTVDVNTLTGTPFVTKLYNVLGGCTNLPVAKGGRLTVMDSYFSSATSQYCLQKYEKRTTDNDIEVWYRVGRSSDSGKTWTWQAWERIANASEIPSISNLLKIDGSNGTAAGVSALLNKLTTGDATPTDDDYYISQYVNGGTTTTTYHRRPMSKVWDYIKGKVLTKFVSFRMGGEDDSALTDEQMATTATSDAYKISLKNTTVSEANGGFRWLTLSKLWSYVKAKISKDASSISLSGTILHRGANEEKEMISFKDGDTNGHGIVIGGGGLTVIGSGESAKIISSGVEGTTERMVVAGDSGVEVTTNLNTGAAAGKTFTFKANGGLSIPGPIDFPSVNIQTGSTLMAKIDIVTLVNWLATKGYITKDYFCQKTIHGGWYFAGNDIIQFTSNGINYELQLAGAEIEFEGSWSDKTDNIQVRVVFTSSTIPSFTPTSGYTGIPANTVVIYKRNASTASWEILSKEGHTHSQYVNVEPNATSADLNTLYDKTATKTIKTNIYRVSANSPNSPESSNPGFLIVNTYLENGYYRITQAFYDNISTGDIYTRVGTASPGTSITWGTWNKQRVTKTSELTNDSGFAKGTYVNGVLTLTL